MFVGKTIVHLTKMIRTVQPKTFKFQSWEAERYFSSHSEVWHSNFMSGLRMCTSCKRERTKITKLRQLQKNRVFNTQNIKARNLGKILCQVNPPHIVTSPHPVFPRCGLTLPSHLLVSTPTGRISREFPRKKSVRVPRLPFSSHMPSPSQPFTFFYYNNNRRPVQLEKFLVM